MFLKLPVMHRFTLYPVCRASDEFAAMEKAQEEDNGMGAFKHEVAGRRRRKDVDYSADLMSDKEWLRSIDEPVDEGEDEDEGSSRKGGKSASRSKKRKAGRVSRMIMRGSRCHVLSLKFGSS